jgi:hypothetical protein
VRTNDFFVHSRDEGERTLHVSVVKGTIKDYAWIMCGKIINAENIIIQS